MNIGTSVANFKIVLSWSNVCICPLKVSLLVNGNMYRVFVWNCVQCNVQDNHINFILYKLKARRVYTQKQCGSGQAFDCMDLRKRHKTSVGITALRKNYEPRPFVHGTGKVNSRPRHVVLACMRTVWNFHVNGPSMGSARQWIALGIIHKAFRIYIMRPTVFSSLDVVTADFEFLVWNLTLPI
jgi:hypothetical protein